MRRQLRLWVLLGTLACAFAPARAALFEDTDARLAILDLRKQVERLNQEAQAGANDNEQLRRALLDMQSQLDALKADVSMLRGERDLLAKDLSDTQRKLKDQAQGIEDRLRKFEPVRVNIDGVEAQVEPAEVKDFESALAVFRKGDFAGSSLMFADFNRRYPQSPYQLQSLFWLGNAQYAIRDYRSALMSFKQLILIKPDHPKALESQLAVANCQVELKDIKAARKTLEDLIKDFPDSEVATAAKDRLSKLK